MLAIKKDCNLLEGNHVKAIINGRLVTPEGIKDQQVLVFDETIVAISEDVPNHCEIIDAKGLIVSPGLIDVHIHGSCGYDVMDHEVEAIKTISRGIAKNGVTSFLPTTMTMHETKIKKALACIQSCMGKDLEGATVLGAHLEGPFINKAYKGAQSETEIIPPSLNVIHDFLDVIKIITIAPELEGSLPFIKAIKEKTAITLSMGHTNATYEEAMSGINEGISHVTHLFNAMTPLTHREPGVVGASLTTDVYTEIIADNIHISPKLFPYILHNKGYDKVILITDSMRAGCM